MSFRLPHKSKYYLSLIVVSLVLPELVMKLSYGLALAIPNLQPDIQYDAKKIMANLSRNLKGIEVLLMSCMQYISVAWGMLILHRLFKITGLIPFVIWMSLFPQLLFFDDLVLIEWIGLMINGALVYILCFWGKWTLIQRVQIYR